MKTLDGHFPQSVKHARICQQRVLTRPWGGWRARQWRREVAAWLWLAWIYLACSATCGLILQAIDFFFSEVI